MKLSHLILTMLIYCAAFTSWGQTNKITVVPRATSTALDFSVGATNLVVADITLAWAPPPFLQSKTYTVKISSQYAGFRHNAGLGTIIPYSVSFKGTTRDITNAPQLFYTVSRFLLGGSEVVPLSITFTGTPFTSLYSGIYSDVLTIIYEVL